MCWSNWYVYIMYYIGMTFMTGAVWTIFWYIAYGILKNHVNVKQLYHFLKLAMAGYAVPVVFLVRLLYYRIVPQMQGYLWSASPLVCRVCAILFAVWVLGMAVTAVCYFVNLKKFKDHYKARFNASQQEKQMLEAVKKKLHIRKNVRIYHGYAVQSPFVYGFIRPCIYLPVQDMSEYSTEVVITHELMHIKHGDVYWRLLFSFLCCVFWFNPLSWMVSGQYQKWAEAYCDNSCYEEHFAASEYFNAILLLVKDYSEWSSPFAPGMREKKSELLWRVEIMSNYRRKRLKRGVSALILTGVLVFSLSATFALQVGTEQLYSYVVDSTLESTQEEIQEPENYLTEYTCDVSELGDVVVEQDGSGISISGDSVVSVASADGSISTSIGAGKTITTSSFYKSAGSELMVAFSVSPSDQTVQVGYIYGGSATYVQGTDHIYHSFTLPSSGYYVVFVKNQGTETVTVYGMYSL